MSMFAVPCLMLAVLSAAPAATSAATSGATAFVDVTVLPMDGDRVLEGQTVVVRDGRIAEMGPSARVKAPKDALAVDGRGKYLMPAIAEMHGHLPGPGTDDKLVGDLMFLFVANGVTIVRGMQGDASQFALRDRILKGDFVGPMLFLGSPALNGGRAPNPETGAKLAQEYKAAGFDLLKIHEGLTVATYDAIVAEAKKAKLPFGGHVPNPVGLDHCLSVSQTTIDHLDGFVEALDDDESKIPAVVAATRKAGTAVVPTMALWQVFYGTETVESLGKRPELRYVPASMSASWADARKQALAGLDVKKGARNLALRDKLLKALSDGGVKVLMGSDAPQQFSVPGFSLHREMKAMAAAGMSPYEILRSGTYNIAEHFGALDSFGTVATGRRADLILLEASPLKDVGHMERRAGVMLRGKWLPEAEIQKRLEAIAAGR
jgi:imidazolonepropionase-like amidohydrolase